MFDRGEKVNRNENRIIGLRKIMYIQYAVAITIIIYNII